MATFLTTPRMSPALRARVERAVSRAARAKFNAAQAGLPGVFARRGGLRLVHLLPLAALSLVVALGLVGASHTRKLLEDERADLLSTLAARREGLPKGHEEFLARTDALIVSEAGKDRLPEVIDPALRGPGALDERLARPLVYVHGAAADLGDAKTLDDAASASMKDAFLVCLLRPPPSASERDLLAQVRGVYFGGGKVDDETKSVRRLAEAREGLRVLGPDVEEKARAAVDVSTLKTLRRDLDHANADLAKQAASADLLLLVADREGDASVALIDLTSKTALLRVRLPLEGVGKAPDAALYRDSLEGCALALAVRRAVEE